MGEFLEAELGLRLRLGLGFVLARIGRIKLIEPNFFTRFDP